MDDDHYTITVRWPDTGAQSESFHGCTNVDNNNDELSFDDSTGKHHQYFGVAYHFVEE